MVFSDLLMNINNVLLTPESKIFTPGKELYTVVPLGCWSYAYNPDIDRNSMSYNGE